MSQHILADQVHVGLKLIQLNGLLLYHYQLITYSIGKR